MTETLKESEDLKTGDDHDHEIMVSGPSREQEGQPVIARNLGMIGLLAVGLGTILWAWNLYENPEVPRFNPSLLRVWWLAGLVLTLIHAVRDRAPRIRRGYGFGGYVLALFGSILLLLPSVTAWTGNLVAGEVIAGLVGLLLVGVTVIPFVGAEVSDNGKWLLGRWWQGLATSSLVQKVSVANLVILAALLAAGYALRQAEVMYLGLASLLLGLVLLVTFVGHETSSTWRSAGIYFLGAVGTWAATAGVLSVVSDWVGLGETVLPYGLIFGVVGLVFLWIFVVLQGSESDLGNRAGWALAIAGLAIVLVTVARILIPALAFPTPNLRVPCGFLLCTLGGLYALVGAALASDNRLLAMTRRELSAYFYSPIAYVVIAGIALVAWGAFYLFISRLLGASEFGAQPVPEPIIGLYLFAFFPVLALIFFVPAVTMRLLSDEKRTGTLEVLLTAPVDEWSVVLSKFFAAWIFFLLTWLVWGVFPIVLRVIGKEDFDYRPLLSFYLGIAFMSAGFIAMGMFFSSLTRNQIIAFILGVAGMVALTALAFLLWMTMGPQTGAAADNKVRLLRLVSYLYHMEELMEGKVHLEHLIYHASLAVFWIFLSVKVLEARKWS